MRRQVQEDDPLYPASSVCVGGYSEHPSHNTHVESSTEFLSNFPIQDFQSGICRSSRSARGRTERNKTSASCLKTKKQSARPCGHQPPSGPHCCKACGKTFHYIYTLRAHARGHTADNVHVCGICGKHLGTSVNLISHLQSSKKGGGCGPQGKLFSNVKKHKACHWQIIFAALKPPFQIICTYWSHWSRVVKISVFMCAKSQFCCFSVMMDLVLRKWQNKNSFLHEFMLFKINPICEFWVCSLKQCKLWLISKYTSKCLTCWCVHIKHIEIIHE